jgi:formamidopyrimidine-DNA glycosylase
MPELPDVEVFRGYVDATALHKKIRGVNHIDTDVLAGCSPATLRRRLKGASFERTRRHGKHLGLEVDSGAWLMLHFGMTGSLDYAKGDRDLPEHSRLVLWFDNGFRLAYVNQRKLGRIRLANDFDSFIADADLGPDALEISRETFRTLLSDGRGTLKTRLMNQNLIAGLGNVYTDELFFQAKIYPGTPVSDVGENAAGKLWRTMRRMLRTVIDRGAQADRFPDSWLTPHRGDDACPRCGAALKHRKFEGRTTWYCSACQKPRSA